MTTPTPATRPPMPEDYPDTDTGFADYIAANARRAPAMTTPDARSLLTALEKPNPWRDPLWEPLPTTPREAALADVDFLHERAMAGRRFASEIQEINGAAIRLRAALAAPAAPATLDVERLARAIKSVLPWDDDPWILDQAAAIAAAYESEEV